MYRLKLIVLFIGLMFSFNGNLVNKNIFFYFIIYIKKIFLLFNIIN